MPVSYIRPGLLPRTGKQYAIVGYPALKAKPNPKTKTIPAAAYAHHAASIPDANYAAHGFHPGQHILLPLNLQENYDLHGRHTHFPKPQGMSGAPVWVLFEDTPDDQQQTFPVVGVGIEYRKDTKLLIATDVATVVNMINAAV